MRPRDLASGPGAGAIVPHAPLLLPLVGGGDTHPEVHAIRQAAARLDPDEVEVLVVLSPHGSSTGVYRGCSGDLSEFGVPDITVEGEVDAAAAEQLAAAWRVPGLDAPVDHGVLVPLKLIDAASAPVVAACLAEKTDAQTSDEVNRFVEAIRELGRSRRVFFVASANTSAGLTPRAPLTELPGAADVEAALRAALERNPGGLDGLATELAEVGGSCSRGPLAAFGALFAGRPAQVLAHVWPYGVGYIVAAAGTAVRT